MRLHEIFLSNVYKYTIYFMHSWTVGWWRWRTSFAGSQEPIWPWSTSNELPIYFSKDSLWPPNWEQVWRPSSTCMLNSQSLLQSKCIWCCYIQYVLQIKGIETSLHLGFLFWKDKPILRGFANQFFSSNVWNFFKVLYWKYVCNLDEIHKFFSIYKVSAECIGIHSLFTSDWY